MKKTNIKLKHIVMEIVGYVFVFISFMIAVVGNVLIDGEIAIGFDENGIPEEYGSPANLFVVPCILLFLPVTMSIIMHIVPDRYYNVIMAGYSVKTPASIEGTNTLLMEFNILTGLYSIYVTLMLALQLTKLITFGTITYIVIMFILSIVSSIWIKRKSKTK